MSKTIGIAKKLRAIYEEDPTIFDMCSVEEILQMITPKFIPIDEPDDMIYEDEYNDPTVRGGNIYE